MTTKSHNAKKPKLAEHHAGHAHEQTPSVLPGSPLASGGEAAAPGKHKMSFAQHQHELQVEHTASAVPEAPTRHLKSDAQQHQQKSHNSK